VTKHSLKTVILCGGLGTRLREETEYRPKPLMPIGDRPILWHIMKIYAASGHKDFFLALGYKGELIKDYFLNYELRNSDFTLRLGTGETSLIEPADDDHDWTISFIDTGLSTMTGGRLLKLRPYLESEPEFLVTYGDGVADLDINEVVAQHRRSGVAVTVTAVRPTARFGELVVDGERVVDFAEKPLDGEDWVSGGFFVMSPRVFDYLSGPGTVLEGEPLKRVAADGQMGVYRHRGFWQCMDTPREMTALNEMWSSGEAPWKVWR
jgi:glucose-1-phosphate cytidylyltransferase